MMTSRKRKNIILGTALWGWGIDQRTAYELLDNFVQVGGRYIDVAQNYPINKQKQDFGLAAKWLTEWITINGERDVSIILKVGSLDNMGGSETNLSASNIRSSEAEFREKWGAALAALAIHWDNRDDDEFEGIQETINVLSDFFRRGGGIGFSGVQRPDLYLKAAPELAKDWWIQVKENALTDSARLKYSKCFPDSTYIAYGINMGGLKNAPQEDSSSSKLRGIEYSDELILRLSKLLASDHGLNPVPRNFNELALSTMYRSKCLSGVIVAPRSLPQLQSTMSFWKALVEQVSL
ncbi:MAG: aldo/keto reductase [Gammaproteobacteria bacterium]|nr:aldo/keto reductase [Gammaproteobacteria bacterium]